jgi:hypothetical protein
MASVNGLVTTYNIPENAVEIDKEFFQIQLPSTPILNLIGEGKPISSTKLEWWDDVPLPFSFTVASAYTAGGGVIRVSTDDAKLIKVGNILKAGNVYYRVTGVNINTGDITVSVVSGTDADLSAGAKLELISDAMPEASEYVDSGFVTAVKRYNVTQIFTETIKFSDTQRSADVEYNLNLLAAKTQEKMKKLRILLERTIILGKLYEPSDNSGARMMSGIDEFITNNGVTTSGAFSEANFKTWLELLYYQRQNQPIDVVWMHPKTKENFNALLQDKIVTAPRDQVAGGVRSIYISEWGEVELRSAPQLPQNKIYYIDVNKIKVRPFRPLHMWELPKNGDYTAYMMVGEYTLEVRDSALMGVWTLA